MKFAEQQSTSSMIKCLLFRLFSIHYNGSINSPTRCFLLIQHRPTFYESKKNNMMSWQHAIYRLKVLMTGNIWKKKWLFWMTHEYTRCPIQLSQSKVFNWQHQKALISSTNEKIMLNARSIIKVFALLSKAI